MKRQELEGMVKSITPQGAVIKSIDENGKETGEEYFAHLGDIRENEELLYDLRDHKLTDVETIYDRFVTLEEDQRVKFKAWDGNAESKPHAFNVERKK